MRNCVGFLQIRSHLSKFPVKLLHYTIHALKLFDPCSSPHTHGFAPLFFFLLYNKIRIQQITSSVRIKAPTAVAITMIIENDPLVLSPGSSKIQKLS